MAATTDRAPHEASGPEKTAPAAAAECHWALQTM